MIVKDVKFAELEQLLLSIGFVEVPTTGSHRVYEYSPLGTLVVLPGYEQQANVRTMHIVAVRKILHENGLMDKDMFTSFFEKEERRKKRREAMKEFTQFLQEEGFYDDEGVAP